MDILKIRIKIIFSNGWIIFGQSDLVIMMLDARY
jgi:hypothetical protein